MLFLIIQVWNGSLPYLFESRSTFFRAMNASGCFSLQCSGRANRCNLRKRPGESGAGPAPAPLTTDAEIKSVWIAFFVFQMLYLLCHLPTPFVSLSDWSPWILLQSRHTGLFVKKLTFFRINMVKQGSSLDGNISHLIQACQNKIETKSVNAVFFLTASYQMHLVTVDPRVR